MSKYIAVSKLKELWEKSSIADWEYCTKTWLDISKAIESGELETVLLPEFKGPRI